MSWTDELYKVYEQQCGNTANSKSVLVPLFHEIKVAQIEITIKEDGSFVNAELLTPEEGANTIFPCAKIRTSNVAAYAFADELIYICGDYSKYVQTKIKSENDNIENIVDVDNSIYFSSYEMGLKNWMNSNYTHPAVSAVYKYISKKSVLTDLIESHLFVLDSNLKIMDTTKISTSKNTILKKAFVRFKIIYKDFSKESRTWLDSELYRLFELYSCSLPHSKQLCYASGEEVECTYSHATLGLPVFPQAKIISSNDKENYTFRGRFSKAEEAISVGKIYSEKIHKALKWLMTNGYSLKLGEAFDAKRSPLMLVVWSNDFEPMPTIWEDSISNSSEPDDDETFETVVYPTNELIYRHYLKKRIWGTKDFDITSRVIIMLMEATNKGRVSIGLYMELDKSTFFNNLNKWHSETGTLRFYAKQRTNRINSFAVREIINCAYGIENGSGFLETKPEIVKENVLRLLPCITQGRALPADIVQNLVKKASNPLAYEHSYNHRNVIETACGMIRKQNFENLDRKRGIISMAYDPNEKDRSYLFGCLLAIADAAEYESYDKEDKGIRVTNARRYWTMFAKRPFTIWGTIERQVRIYMPKLDKKRRDYYEGELNSVMGKFEMNEFSDNSSLTSAYLLGYHHYIVKIKGFKKTEEE